MRAGSLPAVLSVEEVGDILAAAPGPGLKYRAALGISYGAGLRAAEVCHLRGQDIDSVRMNALLSGLPPERIACIVLVRHGETAEERADAQRLLLVVDARRPVQRAQREDQGRTER